jgi:hypothetical protein
MASWLKSKHLRIDSQSLSLNIKSTLLNQVPTRSQPDPPPLRPKLCHLEFSLSLHLQALLLFHLKTEPNPYHIRNLYRPSSYPHIRCSRPSVTRVWSIPIHLPRIPKQRLLLLYTRAPIWVMHTVFKPTRTYEL